MKGPTHQLIGAIASIIAVAMDDDRKISPVHHSAAAGAIGAILGRLPDMLEPSVGNPHHRQFYHSFTMLGMASWGVHKMYKWEPQNDMEKLLRGIILIGGIAYLSHLVSDAFTKRSLPLVGRI